MYWILATVFILAALAIPRLRPLGVVGCIVLGTMLGWGMLQRLRGNDSQQSRSVEQRGRPSSPATELQAVALSLVAVENLRLTGGGAPFELRGRIVNNASGVMLKSVTIRVIRSDCYEGALDPSGCARLWQDDRWIPISVPAGQARDFLDVIWMRGNAPRARGTLRDSFQVVAAAGESVADVEGPAR